jgi:hypothetical protein
MLTWPSGQPTRTALATVLCAALALPARAAEPPPPQDTAAPPASQAGGLDQAEALRLFREARALYTAGDPRAAALAFERSYAAAASAEAAYNAALAHDKADDPIATLTWYRRYLDVAQKDTDPSYPLALARVEELRARVGELRVELERPGEVREVRVNGQSVPLDSFPRVILPGPVELTFVGAAPGQTVDIPSEVRAGEAATIYFPGFARPLVTPPAPKPVARPDPPPDPGPSPRQRNLKIAFWTGTGLTAASAVVMGALGGAALREQRLYAEGACVDGECPDGFVDYETWYAHNTSAARYRDATNAMIGVTIGLAVATLGLGIAALLESRRPRAGTRAGHVVPAAGGLLVAF